jgi:hypothetical protein
MPALRYAAGPAARDQGHDQALKQVCMATACAALRNERVTVVITAPTRPQEANSAGHRRHS